MTISSVLDPALRNPPSALKLSGTLDTLDARREQQAIARRIRRDGY